MAVPVEEGRTSDILVNTSDVNEKKEGLQNLNDGQSAKAEAPPRNISGWKWHSTFVAILFSNFLYAPDATIIADLQPVMVEQFDSIENLAWLSVALLLTASVTNLIWGRFYGHLNTKWFYIFHVTIFEIDTAIYGAAPSMNAMIAGRAIAGVGGAGQYVGLMTLIASNTTPKERPLYLSCTGPVWGIGIVLGLVVGRIFSQSLVGSRWAIYINIIMFAACFPFYLFFIPNKDPRPRASFRERTSEMDYAGILLQLVYVPQTKLDMNRRSIEGTEWLRSHRSINATWTSQRNHTFVKAFSYCHQYFGANMNSKRGCFA